MERFPKSRAEIESLVLEELQASENCEGAVGISVVAWISSADEVKLDGCGLQTRHIQ
jgi:hypothetical protein